MRLIDADALIDRLDYCVKEGMGSTIAFTFKHMVDDVPTIEPKRGEWVKRTHNTLIAQVNFAYCSECGQPIMHEHTRPLWSFCPNCGARMKGADDETD